MVLDHHVIFGTPDEDATWAGLDALLRSRWTHPNGGTLKMRAAVVDSGDGDWTDQVYSFRIPRLNRWILDGKGVCGSVRPS